jgi:L-threonylcarbamoyladenylate synthase
LCSELVKKMRTLVLRPDADAIAQAAAILHAGGLVAFPTETVYGLGANALDVRAVAGIFAAKGRPSHNPIIVHVARLADAVALANSWPESAQRLAERFWPGPLTLVVPASHKIPTLVTAGGPTVGLRVPSHPVAQALLKKADSPLAAPSANRSAHLSPTRAEHVVTDLADRIPLVLDAGPTPGGLESTVLDVSVFPPQLLRPGLVSPSQIEGIIGPITRQQAITPGKPVASPGLLGRHYAPQAPLECTIGDGWQRVGELAEEGLRVGWLTFGEQPAKSRLSARHVVLAMPTDPVQYAAQLYSAIHALDGLGLDRIVVGLPPMDDPWLAVHDRLRRAAQEG